MAVEPRGYLGPEVGRISDLTVPLRTLERLSGRQPWYEAFTTWLMIVGRLQDTATLAQAQQELNLIYRQVNFAAAASANQQRVARESDLTVEAAAGGGWSGLRDSYQRWLRLLLMLLGAVARIGLYGLMTFSVAQRTGELGLRMALGAMSRSVRALVLRENAATVMTGVLFGLGGAVATGRLVQTQLFGLNSNDPVTLVSSAGLLLVMALAAAYIPAARASRVDPIRALRHE